MGRSLGQTVKSKQSKQQRTRQRNDEPRSPSPSLTPSSLPPSRADSVAVEPGKRPIDDDEGVTTSPRSTCTSDATLAPRPKRRATNAHIIRFLQTRNPNKLEEDDLRRALEASLEECPDFWPAEDTASCSSSDQSNAPSASSNSSSTGGGSGGGTRKASNATGAANGKQRRGRPASSKRNSQSLTMQHNHQISNICNCQQISNSNNNINYPPSSNCALAYTNRCPMSNVHNRFKPVTKKNIYSESDFFHDGIMEYIEYELKQRGLII